MATEKVNHVKITTPAGVAVYPWLVTPDVKFNALGEYRLTLALDHKDPKVKAFCSQLEGYVEDSYKEAVEAAKPADKNKIKRGGVVIEEYNDDGSATGRVLVKFKMKAKFQTKSGDWIEQAPKLFDAKGNLLHDVNPYGGTICKVNAEVVPFMLASTKEASVSLRLKAVQIIQLVEGSGAASAAAYGFEEEDGYVAPVAAPSKAAVPDETPDDEDNPF